MCGLASGTISILGLPPHRALRQNLVAYVPQSEEVDWSFPVLVEDVVMMGRYGHMGYVCVVAKEMRYVRSSPTRWKRVDMLELAPSANRRAVRWTEEARRFWRVRLPSRAR